MARQPTTDARRGGAIEDPPRGAVPEANQPGHHPDREQDRPDPDAFVERFRHPPTVDEAGDRDPTGTPVHHVKRLVGIGALLVVAVGGAVLRRVRHR
jgi:hypothetical protein